VIDRQANETVNSDGLVTIEKSVLEALVERDSLNIREVELFKAVDCWVTIKCQKARPSSRGFRERKDP